MMGNTPEQNVIGNEVVVRFTSLNNKEIKGKIDTGATNSSLHATNVKVDPNGGRVSFVCDALSPNVLTMELDGTQTVHSADHGGDHRPMVRLDVEVSGVGLQGASFNLNDRSQMDSQLLIGQNILKAGNFIIDVNKGSDGEQGGNAELPATPVPESVDKEEKIIEAIRVLSEADISLSDLVKYLKTQAVISIKE